MTVRELNREQLRELKGAYIDEKNAERGEGTSYYEFVFADEIVTDTEIFDAYAGYEFTPGDFGSEAE